MKLTRRELAAALASGVAVGAAQTESTGPSVPSTPQQELEAARERNRETAAALAGYAVPMAAEPAFQFKA
jgi:hypothetical protein